jgi:hypothetical protein
MCHLSTLNILFDADLRVYMTILLQLIDTIRLRIVEYYQVHEAAQLASSTLSDWKPMERLYKAGIHMNK